MPYFRHFFFLIIFNRLLAILFSAILRTCLTLSTFTPNSEPISLKICLIQGIHPIFTPLYKNHIKPFFFVSSCVLTPQRSEEHTSELQSRFDLVCRLLLEKKKKNKTKTHRRREYKTDMQRHTT